ncbi:MAG: class I SAM-dependent methyltransferase [Dehalococcoidia bacterium]|nr:class I SAM-dependent methyltransferase [Dehalococcoidia bacterium]MYD29692.1 class I SAM-dependent methyltransferase [Dehalococcoidia bacterium]
MDNPNAATYGDRFAGIYDEVHAHLSTPEVVAPMVDVLAELAGGGRVLELGIGTGRIAAPLARRSVEVHGVDASEAMVAKMREKPGGDGIPVTIGDFEQMEVEGHWSLIYVVFNTLFALPSQEAQVNCFRSVAEHLTDGGAFLVEAFVPDMTRFDRDQRVSTGIVEHDLVSIDLDRHDPTTQTVASSHIYITPEGVQMYPVDIRYAWPSELDLMAQLAGMRLRSRWSDWRRNPFTSASTGHVSIYERA